MEHKNGHDSDIMVSVSCLAYNHEKYIRQCLDGLVSQKTNFKYEVLVHDDASTDNTATIIREYEKKYPDIIKPIYQTENQYSKNVAINKHFQFPRIKGKYIAWCEGDDFWTDPLKLQKQFDVLESNPDCSICVAKVADVNENGNKTGKFHPKHNMDTGIITSSEYMDFISKFETYQFQTSSFFIRSNIIKSVLTDPPEFFFSFMVGDVPYMLLSISKGNLYYINEEMSCYRTMANGSWSQRVTENPNKKIKALNNEIFGFNLFNKYTDYVYQKNIEEIVREKEFLVGFLEKNGKTILQRKYRKYLKNYLTKKEIIFIVIMTYFPKTFKILKKGE